MEKESIKLKLFKNGLNLMPSLKLKMLFIVQYIKLLTRKSFSFLNNVLIHTIKHMNFTPELKSKRLNN